MDINKANRINYAKRISPFYTCCNCLRTVTLDESVSSSGHHLICTPCLKKIAELLNQPEYKILQMIQA